MTKPYIISEDSSLLRPIPSRSTLLSHRLMSIASKASYYNYDTIEDTEISIYATVIVILASLGGFSFGYCTAIVSGVLVSIGADLDSHDLTPLQQQSIASATSISAILGCILCGYLADRLGRKKIILICCLVFSLCSLQMALCSTYVYFLLGRFVTGILVGSVSMIVPIYVSEVAPSRLRGSLMTLNSLGTTMGQLSAYLASALLENHKHSWRAMVVIGSIAPTVFLFLSPFVCESPRWLIMQNRIDEAFYCFKLIFPQSEDYQVDDKIKLIQRDLGISTRTGFKRVEPPSMWQKLTGSKGTIRALVIGCGLFVAQQLSGISAFLSYSATLFSSAGMNSPLKAAIFIATANFTFTCLNVVLIDIMGRRKLLLHTMWIMALALVMTGYSFGRLTPESSSSFSTQSLLDPSSMLVISLVAFVSFYASALGVVPWCSVEFLPQESRSAGTMFMSCVNWGTNYLVSSTFLDLTALLKVSGACFLFATFSIIFWVLVYKFYPEVSGIPLEDIGKIFENGFDITYAENLRKDLGIGCDNSSDVESRHFMDNASRLRLSSTYSAIN